MKVLVRHELRYYIKNPQQVIYIYSYYLLVIVLVSFSANLGALASQELAVVALWIALVSGMAVGATGLFRRDQKEGRLEYLQLLPINLESVVAAKWLAYLVFTLIPLWAALPLAGILFNLSDQAILHDAIGLTAGAIALSSITTLIHALTTGIDKAGAVLSLVMLPLSIPILIFGAGYCRDLTLLWQPNLAFMLGFAVLMLPIMCLGGAYAIRASN